MDHSNQRVFVTGATGRQGMAVVRRLLTDGWQVTALTRDPYSPVAVQLADLGAAVVGGDMEDVAALTVAMRGSYGAFSVQPASGSDVSPDFVWADEVRWGKNTADAAKAAAVEFFVYTSANGADKESGLPVLESKREIEAHIKAIGLPSAVVRPSSFMENYARRRVGLLKNGRLATALRPDVGQQLIALEDIAYFVELAFRDPAHFEGRALDLAGDDLTPPQISEMLSRAVGRQIPYHEVTIGDLLERAESENVARGYTWLNERKMTLADIPALRELHPGLMDFQTWLDRGGAQQVRAFLDEEARALS